MPDPQLALNKCVDYMMESKKYDYDYAVIDWGHIYVPFVWYFQLCKLKYFDRNFE